MSDMSDMKEYLSKLHALRRYCATPFFVTFGVPLARFWDNVTGFDLIKFDEEFVKSPDQMSMKEVIQAQWGDEAVKLVERLIG